MASSVDPSVKRLIARINEMETSRRLVMMRLKEAEVSLTYLTEEQTRHKQKSTSLADKELSLMRQLQVSVEEQRQLQVRHHNNLVSMDSSVKQEPLLLRMAETKIAEAEAQRDGWTNKMDSLHTAQRKWKSTEESVDQKKSLLVSLQEEIQTLEQEEQRLLAEEAEAALIRQQQRQQQQSANRMSNGNIAVSVNSSDGGASSAAAIVALKARMEAEAVAADEYSVQSSRQLSIAQREVTDLERRVAEFSQWMQESSGTKHQLEEEIASIQTALQRKMCADCA